MPVALFSQVFTGNGALVSVKSGGVLTIRGDALAKASTIISNDGDINLTGNITNNSGNNLFGTSQGTITLNGTAQSIAGNSTIAFNNLILQNTITILNQNTITGGANATPAGTLSINNSVLDLNSKELFINNDAGAAITYSAGYILSEKADNSSTVKWLVKSNTGVHTVPFGSNSGVQLPVSFNLTTGNAGEVVFSTFPTAANNTPLPVSPQNVTHVRNFAGIDNSANTVDRFWYLSGSGNPTANLTLTWASAENAASGNVSPKAQRWVQIGERWENILPGQLNPTAQSVLIPSVTDFGTWAVARQDAPLPIELISFNAKALKNKEVLCSWVTASEINNDYFTLERSIDNYNFEFTTQIDGAGNSSALHNYSFSDKNPYDGISYYRLKQTDFDGSFSYTKSVAVSFSKKNSFNVYPSLTSGILYITVSNLFTNSEIFITDLQGRLLISKPISINTNQAELNIQTFAPGIYFVNLKQATGIDSIKVTKL